MKLRNPFILGLLLLLAGCATLLYLPIEMITTSMAGIYKAYETEITAPAFPEFDCPALVNSSEKFLIHVKINNPTDELLTYSVQLEAAGFMILSGEETSEVSIAARQSKDLTWKISSLHLGGQTVTVTAISSKDDALPGPFHDYPTSYREGRGIVVMIGSLAYQAVMVTAAALVIVGGCLVWVGWRQRRAR